MSGCIFVYIIAHSENNKPKAPVKIGVSANPDARLKSIQTGNPSPLVVLTWFRCPTREIAYELESAFHEVKGEFRKTGEWFDIHPMDAVQAMCTNVRSYLARVFDRDPEHHRDALEYSGVLETEAQLEDWRWFSRLSSNDNGGKDGAN